MSLNNPFFFLTPSLTNNTCIATPGDPDVYATPVVTTTTTPGQDDKPTMEMGDDVVGCKEDLLTNRDPVVAVTHEDPVDTPDVPGTPRSPQPCVHDRLGVCNLHGPGATKYFCPVRSKNPGVGTKRVYRQSYWECEATRGGKKKTQTRMTSFLMKTTPRR